MPKIPKYYVRPDGLHETIIMVPTADGGKKRKAFRGKTDLEVWNKVKSYDMAKEPHPTGVRFEQVAERWWEQITPTLTYNTEKGYTTAYQRAKDYFNGEIVSQITTNDINDFIHDFAKTRAKKTVITQLQIVRQIFDQAQTEGLIMYNPASICKIPKHLPQKQRELPSKDEIELIKKSKDMQFGLFAYLVYYTGCRRGEALALTGADIDRKNKIVHITKSVYTENGHARIKEPKTEKGKRKVPLLDALSDALPARLPKGYLFSADDGKTPLSTGQFEKRYKKYQIASGVTVMPHQIRHGYATALFEAGIDPKTAQTLLGHAQLSTTMDIYTHVRDDVIQRAAEKMSVNF